MPAEACSRLDRPGRDFEALYSHLYVTYHGAIVKFLRRRLGDDERAQELAQDAFLRAWLALPAALERDPALALRPWLYRVAERAALDVLRHDRRLRCTDVDELARAAEGAEGATALRVDVRAYRRAVGRVEDGPQAALRAEAAEEVRTILAQLPPPSREALVWHEVGGRTCADIAAALGVTTQAVKSRLFRARRRFRALARRRGYWPEYAPAAVAAVAAVRASPARAPNGSRSAG